MIAQTYTTPTQCPKCNAPLSDWWDKEPISVFVGEWSEDRFRCEAYHSCGYFGLEDFGIAYCEEVRVVNAS